MTDAAAFFPVDAIVPQLLDALKSKGRAVVIAPPGAGKSTRLPLALLQSPHLHGKTILLLEPRRIAARALAEFMARTLGERVGQTVGLSVRFESKTSAQTRLEVMTEGVFLKRLIADPELNGVGAVLFDEAHERSLETDAGLALMREIIEALRPDLQLVVMSATLDGETFAQALGAPLISAAGRAYPITTHYRPRLPNGRLEEDVARVVIEAHRHEEGSLLVFLPGMGEIRRVEALLLEQFPASSRTDVYALHGSMSLDEQASAIAPAKEGRRKIVLTTSVAETSLTIEDVRVVIDCGLARVADFEPDLRIASLHTRRVSRASAEQRRGRAGRVAAGVCYRLWSEPETQGLLPHNPLDIYTSDLSSLLLDLAAFGVREPLSLQWLTPPSTPRLIAAREHLMSIGALDEDLRLTELGQKIRAFALPPSLAAMVLAATERGAGQRAADLALVLHERGLGGASVDLEERMRMFAADRSPRAQKARQSLPRFDDEKGGSALSLAEIMLPAFADRVGQKRSGQHGVFLLSSGREARLDGASPLAKEPFILAGELTGSLERATITAALACTRAEIERVLDEQMTHTQTFEFDAAHLKTRRIARKKLGALVFYEQASGALLSDAPDLVCAALHQQGLALLPHFEAVWPLVVRLKFMRRFDVAWPDFSADALLASLEEWLIPMLSGVASLHELSEGLLRQALLMRLDFEQQQRFERALPAHWLAPSGVSHPIDYECEQAPLVSLKVQEVFGITRHPQIGEPPLPLTFALLSPARRPLQITRDLPQFWAGSWEDVRKQMRAEYPKHLWPEDPANTAPSQRSIKPKS